VTLSPITLEGTMFIVTVGEGLTPPELARYTELVPAMITNDAYTDPVVFCHQVRVARELAVWITGNEAIRDQA